MTREYCINLSIQPINQAKCLLCKEPLHCGEVLSHKSVFYFLCGKIFQLNNLSTSTCPCCGCPNESTCHITIAQILVAHHRFCPSWHGSMIQTWMGHWFVARPDFCLLLHFNLSLLGMWRTVIIWDGNPSLKTKSHSVSLTCNMISFTVPTPTFSYPSRPHSLCSTLYASHICSGYTGM